MKNLNPDSGVNIKPIKDRLLGLEIRPITDGFLIIERWLWKNEKSQLIYDYRDVGAVVENILREVKS